MPSRPPQNKCRSADCRIVVRANRTKSTLFQLSGVGLQVDKGRLIKQAGVRRATPWRRLQPLGAEIAYLLDNDSW